jgi:hypothetical protein
VIDGLHRDRKARARGVTGRRDLLWRRDNGGWILCYRSIQLLCVVPAGPGLWRVVGENGCKSDVANLTWTKHAAMTVALAILNRSETRNQWGHAGPQARRHRRSRDWQGKQR